VAGEELVIGGYPSEADRLVQKLNDEAEKFRSKQNDEHNSRQIEMGDVRTKGLGMMAVEGENSEFIADL
jgi:hypothetical protein